MAGFRHRVAAIEALQNPLFLVGVEIVMLRIASFCMSSLLLISSTVANSAELKVFTSRAVWTVLREIGPEFEKETGHKLTLITGLSSEFLTRINAGEPFDIVAAPPPVLDGLIQNGKFLRHPRSTSSGRPSAWSFAPEPPSPISAR